MGGREERNRRDREIDSETLEKDENRKREEMYLKDETNVIVNINLIGRETKRGKEKDQIVRTKRQEMEGKGNRGERMKRHERANYTHDRIDVQSQY